MSVPVPTQQILKDTFFLGHPIYCVFTREITQTGTQWPHSPILLQHNATGLTEPQASSISSQIGNTTTKLWLFAAQLSYRHNVILLPSVTSSHSEAAPNSCHKSMDGIWIYATISCTNQKYSPMVSPKPPCCTTEYPKSLLRQVFLICWNIWATSCKYALTLCGLAAQGEVVKSNELSKWQNFT